MGKGFATLIVGVLMLVCMEWSYAAEAAASPEESTEIPAATDPKAPDARLDEVVVTATRSEKSLDNVPGDAHVVTRREIEKRNVRTVDEALKYVPGVYDRRGKGLMDTLSSITLRGIPDAKRTLILKDGMVMNDSYTGNVTWGGMSVDDIERIEVVEGPFSSLYGGNAIGGVVNIITKMPEKREATMKTGYGTSQYRGTAMDDLRKVYLSYGDRLFNALSLFVSYGYQQTNGFATDLNVQSTMPDNVNLLKQKGKTVPTNAIKGWYWTTDNKGNNRYVIGDKGDNRWWDDAISARASYDFSKVTKLTASYERTRYEYNRDEPHTYLQISLPEVWRQKLSSTLVYSYNNNAVRENSFVSGNGGTEIARYSLSFETAISDVKAKLNAGVLDTYRDWYTTPSSSKTPGYATIDGGWGKVSSTPARSYFSDLQVTIPLAANNILTVGGSFKHGKADNSEYDITNWKDETSRTSLTYTAGGKDTSYAVFVQDEYSILSNLTAYLGFRQDWWSTEDGYANQIGSAGYPKSYDSRSASSFSPKFALVYKPFDSTTLRSSVGKAFRAPTVYELYRTWTSSTGITYYGNPDLKPETAVSWDFSAEQGLWKGAKVKATYFENYLKNLIYRKKISDTQQEYINAGKAESRGVVAEIEQRIEWLRLFANATFTDAKIKENTASPASEGKYLTQVPRRMYNVGLEIEKGPFLYSITGNYVSKRYASDDNSDIVNGVWTSYDPYFVVNTKLSYKACKTATLSLAIDNLFNRNYFAYYKTPGRSWYTELTLNF